MAHHLAATSNPSAGCLSTDLPRVVDERDPEARGLCQRAQAVQLRLCVLPRRVLPRQERQPPRVPAHLLGTASRPPAEGHKQWCGIVR